MVRLIYIVLLQLLILLPFHTRATGSDSLKCRVIDQSGVPLSGVKVSIEGSDFYTSDARGNFKMLPSRNLMMPIKIKVVKEGYQMEEYAFMDSDNELEIVVKKTMDGVAYKETRIRIVNEKGQNWAGAKVKIGKGNYISDREGFVTLRGELPEDAKVVVNGLEKNRVEFSEEGNYYLVSPIVETVIAKDPGTSQGSNDPISPRLNNEDRADSRKGNKQGDSTSKEVMTEKQINEIVFSQYMGDFNKVSDALLEERKRLEESNKKIQEEINKITAKLNTEKHLTEEQRKDLQAYLERLNNILKENSIAFHKTQEKTAFLIHKLQAALAQKDSINLAAVKRAEKAEREKIITDKKFKRNLIIFSIITCALLILAVVFYAIAAKMKKQRKELMKANEELQRIRKNMPHSIEEDSV